MLEALRLLIDAAAPRLLELLQSGRDPASIQLTELISTDALSRVLSAREAAAAYVDRGRA